MEVTYVLRSGFVLANHRLRILALDLLWKFFHFVSMVVLISASVAWRIQDLSKYRWHGPELAPSNPILLAMALAEVWTRYAGTLAWTAFGLVACAIGLWIVFEALFRGGVEKFWIYAGARVAFLAIMVSATVVLVTLTAYEGLAEPDGTIQAGIVSAVVLSGIWWIVSIAETLVRRDALELLATNLTVVWGALGTLLGVQLLLSAASIAVVGLSIKLMLHSSSPGPFLGAGFLMMSAIFFWTIIHSYLVVVRYSTIDIMRDNVVES